MREQQTTIETVLKQSDQDRIRRTWARAAAVPDETAMLFYSNLFRLDPSTRSLFRSDLKQQGQKLVQTLGFIVDHLDVPDTLVPAAKGLAVRHVEYGVVADQYVSVGTALVKTLEQLLGREFSDEDQRAWIEVYGTLSSIMIETAHAD